VNLRQRRLASGSSPDGVFRGRESGFHIVLVFGVVAGSTECSVNYILLLELSDEFMGVKQFFFLGRKITLWLS
jgi:hypothetical protein